jgi:hypothetical protein
VDLFERDGGHAPRSVHGDDATGARDFDVMLEAKAKDLALLRLREQLADRAL